MIIGAPKCGTTTLYSWLKDHPDIFMPEAKEPHYFAQHLSDRYCRVRKLEDYEALFSDKRENQICGEASVLYGFSEESLKQILAHNADTKIIMMLRHPIDMIVSYHGQLLVNLEEDVKSFNQAWALQNDRKAGDKLPSTAKDYSLLQYKEIGSLAKHLQTAQDIIPEHNLKVILLDDMAENPLEIYNDILDFLSVRRDNRVDFGRENEASAVKSQLIERLRRSQNPFAKFIKSILKKLPFAERLNSVNQAKRVQVKINQDVLQETYDCFDSDIKALETFFGKKLKTKYER
ncbi:MAG: sulfotransferase domain-containing protein [Alphaproteobacteria bacterium]|nr:sulfotransferase domain-containing protein [Alphaproteobacteria bacterium]